MLIPSKRAAAIFSVIAAAACWGVAGVVSKLLMDKATPMLVLTVQLSSSVLLTWAILVIKFDRIEISKDTLLVFSFGILHPGLSNTLGIVGLAHLDASIASTIWALEAIATIMLAAVMLDENFSSSQIALSIIAVTGVYLTTVHADQAADVLEIVYGVTLTIIAVISCAVYSVFSRRAFAVHPVDPILLVAGQHTVGLAWVFLAYPLHWSWTKLGEISQLSSGAWLLIVASGLLGFFVANGLYLNGLRHLPAGYASYWLILTPVFGLASAFLLLEESLSLWQCIGIGIILLSAIGFAFSRAK